MTPTYGSNRTKRYEISFPTAGRANAYAQGALDTIEILLQVVDDPNEFSTPAKSARYLVSLVTEVLRTRRALGDSE